MRTRSLLLLAAASVALAPRRASLALLALPYVRDAAPTHGGGWLGRARSAAELAGRAVVDVSELAAMLEGSVRYRTLIL
jgi:hypothetical protein